MVRAMILIVTLLKGVIIFLLPLMFNIMGDGPHSDEFYLTIYILKCVFSLVAVWVISDGFITLLKSYDTNNVK